MMCWKYELRFTAFRRLQLQRKLNSVAMVNILLQAALLALSCQLTKGWKPPSVHLQAVGFGAKWRHSFENYVLHLQNADSSAAPQIQTETADVGLMVLMGSEVRQPPHGDLSNFWQHLASLRCKEDLGKKNWDTNDHSGPNKAHGYLWRKGEVFWIKSVSQKK